jgi:uncharacterized protein (DUF2141 family)
MNKMKLSSISKNLIVIFFAITVFYGCASIQQPQGGPRDTTPPKILKMLPENKMVNFKAEKVVIEFDEYYRIDNEFKEFSVSPEMPRPPVLKKKGKKLEITFPDSLENNTTYTLNFGKAIVDVNEGNVVKNLTYVFATGAHLDSLTIKGRVTNSFTGLPELDAIAFILPLNKDTLLGKKKPSIYTTTDSSGNYTLSNLRKDTYKVYAIKDKNADKIYQQSSDEIGFIKDSVVLTNNLDSMNMKVFKERATQFRIIDKKLGADGVISFTFNQKLKKPEVVVLEPPTLDVSKKIRFSKTNDSLKVWLTDLSFDSTKISIRDEGKLLQTTTLTRGKKETYLRNLMITDNVEGNNLNPNRSLKISVNLPIESADPKKIILLEDSIPVTDFKLEKDSVDFLSYYIRYPWKQKKEYNLKLSAGTFTAIFNTKNKDFTSIFKLFGKDNYGTLKVKVVTPEKDKSYILDVVNENKIVINSLNIRQDTSVNFTNYKSGKYFIRITYDTNKNGIWDTGNVALRLQPEKIWDEPKELSIKPMWERNETINIPKE